MPTITSPHKSGGKKWIITAIIIVVLAVGGWAAYMLANNTSQTGSNNSGGDKAVGQLKAGNYNYINACDAFTADDLDAITSKASDRMEVTAQFAKATDNTNDPMRTYTSDCLRKTSTKALESDFVRLTIQEFSDPAIQDKQNKLQTLRSASAYTVNDEDLIAKLGADTKPAYTSSGGNQNLYMTMDNKEIKISMDLITDKDHTKEWATAVAVAVKNRITQLVATPSAPPDYSGSDITIGTLAYHQACDLWGTDDYKTLLGLDPDEGWIIAQFAEKTQSVPLIAHSSCSISQKPAKTELDTGDLSFLNDTTVSASVFTNQYISATAADASMTNNGTLVGGVGEKATTMDTATGTSLTFLYSNTVTTVHLDRQKEGAVVKEDADLDLLKQMAETVISRLK